MFEDLRTEAQKNADEIYDRRDRIGHLLLVLRENRRAMQEAEAKIESQIREHETRIEALTQKCNGAYDSDSNPPVADAEKRA